jgi:hypothetical protein
MFCNYIPTEILCKIFHRIAGTKIFVLNNFSEQIITAVLFFDISTAYWPLGYLNSKTSFTAGGIFPCQLPCTSCCAPVKQ